MFTPESLGLLATILTSALALTIQLERLLVAVRAYMHELRGQNLLANQQAVALIEATQNAQPSASPGANTPDTGTQYHSSTMPSASSDASGAE